MGYTSTVPAAIAGLVAALRAWPGLAGTSVYDGPTVSDAKELTAIAVGFTGEQMSRTGAYAEPATPAAEVTAALEGGLALRLTERYPIRSLLAVLNGSRDVVAARTSAYSLLTEVGAAVAADKTLGGAVAMAVLGDHIFTPEQNPRGALVRIVFEVNCQAWTT